MGERPKFDRIEGLSATIAVSQRVPAANPRATVGTMTEINDLWRLLMSRAGQEPGEASPLAGRLPASAFSFNHQAGACPDCDGLGHLLRCDPDKLITHADRPLTDGAMAGTKTGRFYGDPRGQFCAIWTTAATAHGFDPNRPWCDLPEAARTLAMYGSGQREYETTWHFQRDTRDESHQWTTAWKGFAHLVDEEYARKREDHRGGALLPLLSARSCPGCHGGRLNARSGAVRFAGATLPEWCDLSVGEAFSRLQGLIEDPTTSGLDATQGAVAETLVPNLIDRYRTLNELSLGYMTISRPVADLSGGEAQRVRLAAALGADMRGITYVLDEPTTGLHPRDVQRLIAHLRRLRDRGNRVVVVEHDAALIAASDYEVALGPGAGAEGGKLIYAGPPRGEPNLPPLGNSEDPRTLDRETGWIDIEGAHANNLRHLNLRIPKGRLTAVSGVSGSGKSSLALGVLAASAAAGRAVNCTAFEGALDLEAPIQLAVGGSMRTPTSTPATFLGILDPIRTLLAKTDAAKAAGLTKQRFSFNAPAKSGKSGPCPACKGMGRIRTSLDLLPDVWSPCEQCGGARFTADVLACRYRGHHIADILAMDAATAHEVFADQPKVRAGLEAMIQVGLPYLGLGRPGNTLSGGEAQRLRLAAALSGADGAKPRLYLLDEPTRGLQAKDVHKLKDALDRLLEAGHTVVVVEHNLDMIRHADWVIDLGPEAGAEGGGLLYSGLPADLTKVTTSWTGRALAGTLSASAQ
ncbi:excinuclease ABC subunit UvrA [Sulfidibacter corallicola]